MPESIKHPSFECMWKTELKWVSLKAGFLLASTSAKNCDLACSHNKMRWWPGKFEIPTKVYWGSLWSIPCCASPVMLCRLVGQLTKCLFVIGVRWREFLVQADVGPLSRGCHHLGLEMGRMASPSCKGLLNYRSYLKIYHSRKSFCYLDFTMHFLYVLQGRIVNPLCCVIVVVISEHISV